MKPDTETLQVYDDQAADYAELMKPDDIHPILATFIAALPENARVLDFGCGPGFDAAQIARTGAHVDAMDASVEMVAIANGQKNVTAWQTTFDDLDATNKYDAILASFSLLHAPRTDMPRHLAAIHHALKTNGFFQIALKSGTGSARDPLGRLYTYYTETELKSLLTTAGFDHFKIDTGRSVGLDGVMAHWIAILCRRNDNA